ncbi:hypothetical protein [Micromonospora parastrephiae]|nr:hypothetical protein [Micromonospora parastrephiae]
MASSKDKATYPDVPLAQRAVGARRPAATDALGCLDVLEEVFRE